MIYRSALQCETCNQKTIVRIGIGLGKHQEHTIKCPGCSEEMTFGMRVGGKDQPSGSFTVENCQPTSVDPDDKLPVVNVDPDFVVPSDTANKDMSFHRLAQMSNMLKAAEASSGIPLSEALTKTSKVPNGDFLTEWKDLKRTISLTRNGREKLANRKLAEANTAYFSDEPLMGPTDWFFRFSMNLLGTKYAKLFRDVLDEVKYINENYDLSEFAKYYQSEMLEERFERFRSIYTDFFSKYSQFSQVLFQTMMGISPAEDSVVSSVQFDLVKSFYGDAFEIFAGSVDFFACLNNVKGGREFSQFEKTTLNKYRKFDNSSKFNPFAVNIAFTSLCEEKDNQLRNASHHRGMKIETDGRIITYRAGKGGTGEAKEITYAAYLDRSVKIFLQICALSAVELTFCSNQKFPQPFDS